VVLDGDGLRIELPAGWHGRFLRSSPHLSALQAGDFPLVEEDDELGEQSTQRMVPGSVFLSLTEYLPGSGMRADQGAFSQSGIDLPLDPTQFSPGRVADPRPGQTGTQQSFSEAGRAFSLYVVIAGGRSERRRQLLVADHVLGTLSISPGDAI
jgi:hypothetical protein